VFGGYSLLRHGTDTQRERHLPALVDGAETWALGVTEADAGLNTGNLATTAERTGDGFVVDGGKRYISGLDHADRLLLLARTTAPDATDGPLDGLTLFVVDADAVNAEEIPLDIYYPERVYDVTIDGLFLPETSVLGDVDEGLAQLLPTLNLERVALATCSWGAGRSTLDAAVERARHREVWSEPIGAHQAIQHPLADAHADLEVARLFLRRAAWELDAGAASRDGVANVANLKACEAAWNACEAAMTTFGGSSVDMESGVAAAWGFVRHTRSVPVSEEMIRNFVATHELDLPRSY
jgi:acyl-CoA dehydrogenase